MTFEYQTTAEDVIAFNLYHFQHSPTAQRQAQIARAALSVVTGIVTLIVCAVITDGTLLGLVIVLSLLAGGFLFAIHPWIVRITLQKNVQGMLREGRSRSMIGPQRQTFTPEQITSSSAVSSATLSWETVERIVASDTHIFVYLSALSAIMLPRRIFQTDASFQDCFRILCQYQQAYHHSQAELQPSRIAP